MILAKRKGYKGTEGKFDWKNLGVATINAIPALSLIIIVIGGIVTGVFTATEGSAVAVVYALILGILYRNITLKSFWKIVVDVTPAILIFTPLFLPIVKTFGMHPVHFGLILVYNLCIGNITPPVGNTLFVAIKVGNTTLAKTIPYMIWYYVAILIGLLLVTYVPFLSTGLPMAAGLI